MAEWREDPEPGFNLVDDRTEEGEGTPREPYSRRQAIHTTLHEINLHLKSGNFTGARTTALHFTLMGERTRDFVLIYFAEYLQSLCEDLSKLGPIETDEIVTDQIDLIHELLKEASARLADDGKAFLTEEVDKMIEIRGRVTALSVLADKYGRGGWR